MKGNIWDALDILVPSNYEVQVTGRFLLLCPALKRIQANLQYLLRINRSVYNENRSATSARAVRALRESNLDHTGKELFEQLILMLFRTSTCVDGTGTSTVSKY